MTISAPEVVIAHGAGGGEDVIAVMLFAVLILGAVSVPRLLRRSEQEEHEREDEHPRI